MTRLFFLLSTLITVLLSLAAWGEEAPLLLHRAGKTVQDCLWQPTERGERFTSDDINACLDEYGLWEEWEEWLADQSPGDSPACAGAAEAPEWDIPDPRQACGAYMEWDPEAEGCFRTAVPLPPELEAFEPSGYPLVRPPAGVIVLHPDGTWAEATGCPPELFEQTFANNWRFCRDPERNDTIPSLWQLPIDGIPYAEVEQIHHRHAEALRAIDGVQSVGLGANGIVVQTSCPALVPEEVEGVPIVTAPPIRMIAYRPTWLPRRPRPSLESVANIVRVLSSEEVVRLLTPVAAALDKDATELYRELQAGLAVGKLPPWVYQTPPAPESN